LEQNNILGGALDGAGDPENGFIVRGGREVLPVYDSINKPQVLIKAIKAMSK